MTSHLQLIEEAKNTKTLKQLRILKKINKLESYGEERFYAVNSIQCKIAIKIETFESSEFFKDDIKELKKATNKVNAEFGRYVKVRG